MLPGAFRMEWRFPPCLFSMLSRLGSWGGLGGASLAPALHALKVPLMAFS